MTTRPPMPTNRRLPKPATVAPSEDADPAPRPRAPGRAARALAVLRAVAGVALVVGVSGTVAWGARRYVTTTPRFAVREIAVSGNAHRSRDELAAEAGLAEGANVFSVDLDVARARLLADPWVREATLARRLPGTLLVQVTERDAAAIVALGDSYLATREGEIFKRLEAGDPADLPVVTGLTADQVSDDRDGVARAIRRALDVAADYEHGPIAAKAPLQEIHLGAGGAVTLVVGKAAMALALGDPPYRRKLDEAARVLSEVERRGAKPDAILLDNETRPERVVVRVR